MKLQFESNLPYQKQAIASTVDLFRGQTSKQSYFTVVQAYDEVADQEEMGFTRQGIGNRLELNEDSILANLQEVQLRNGLASTQRLKKNQYDFDIEMETGTGKTYVYLRTIFELNKAYGFTKFVIVVPSIAIKEGVFQSLNSTKEHFSNLYDNTVYDFFVYNSGNLDQVRNFATSDNIQIMVINIDAFRRSFEDEAKETKANVIHRSIDRLNGMKPIELIQETHPFVIIDEPQSVDRTPKSKVAIASLHPLCTLRYSATHVEKHNLIYKLSAIDAFDMELVKQIEVASFASKGHHNNAYLCLKSVDNKKGPITAKVEMDVLVKGVVKRKVVTLRQGDDLEEKAKRDVYSGYLVEEINCEKGQEHLTFTTKPDFLEIGKVIGEIDDLAIKEQQIRKTIEEHLNKELALNYRGIKVLSLFFIDRVSNYRYYDENGVAQKGIYAELFEKHYRELIQKPKYHTMFQDIDVDTAADCVHNGYFSQDKKGTFKDTSGKTAADDDAYALIMKEKEKLLSLGEPLRFIFSHSALREGWDNPNVFQICTLNETHSKVKKRQEIGRGLRLCVNQEGKRQFGFATNTLTVMANESYEEFAKTLQKEYEEDEGIRFGLVEEHTFANIQVETPTGETTYLGNEKSSQIYEHFQKIGYINEKGLVQNSLKEAVNQRKIDLPQEFAPQKVAVLEICRKVCSQINVKPVEDKAEVKLNKRVFLSEDFKHLWDLIKHKTTYHVDFSSEKLVEECANTLMQEVYITTSKLFYSKAKVQVSAGGVDATETVHSSVLTTERKQPLPDVVSYLQNQTNLTRKSIVDILVKSKTLDSFKRNPQAYMEEVTKIIHRIMRKFIVDGIKYTKLGDTQYYAQELFDTKELHGYLNRNMIESQKSIYDYVVYDSAVERDFATGLENNESIKLYAKLPDWFKIHTPLGPYNPDWAVMVEDNGDDKLYFIVETKGNMDVDILRPTEKDKITCGAAHFAALGEEVGFTKATLFTDFVETL